MVIETDHREEDRNEARMDASSTLAGSTFGAIAKLARQRTANPLSLVRIQVAPLVTLKIRILIKSLLSEEYSKWHTMDFQ